MHFSWATDLTPNTDILPLGSSLTSLVISRFPFKPSLKPFQQAPLTTGLESIPSPPLKQVDSICCQQAWCWIKLCMIKNNNNNKKNSSDCTSLLAMCCSGGFSCFSQYFSLLLKGLKKTPPEVSLYINRFSKKNTLLDICDFMRSLQAVLEQKILMRAQILSLLN